MNGAEIAKSKGRGGPGIGTLEGHGGLGGA